MKSFSVLSWNIQGEINITGHTPFKYIKPHLEKSGADIIVLQEAVNAKQLFVHKKFLRDYHILIPKQNIRSQNEAGGFNYNIILSKFPFVHVEEIQFPHFKQGRPLEHATCADIKIGKHVVRIYNCHFPIFRASPELRLAMFTYVAKHAKKHSGPTIICGDLNTTVPAQGLNKSIICTWHQIPKLTSNYLAQDERNVFDRTIKNYGFKEVFPLKLPTWSPFKTNKLLPFHLKLDWLMAKGLKPLQYELKPFVSDHAAMYVEFGLRT